MILKSIGDREAATLSLNTLTRFHMETIVDERQIIFTHSNLRLRQFAYTCAVCMQLSLPNCWRGSC